MKSHTAFARAILCAALLTAFAVLAGCGAEKPNAGKSESVLRYASADYTTINPILNTHDELPNIIFSGLMRYDGAGNPVPDLAESYAFDPDTLTYTFKLRPGVKWHDGAEFSARDVQFTLDLLTKSDTLAASITDNYKEIESVNAPDDLTVQIRLSQANAAMLGNLTIGILPKHLLEGKDIMTDAFNQHPIGTGRYRFAAWETGQSITVAKNEAYYGKVPSIDRIIFRIIPDENAKAIQMKAGEVDLAWLNARNIEAFRGAQKYRVYDFTTADYRAIAPNFNQPFWRDNRELVGVLGYALDKETIVKSVLNGQGCVAYSPLQLNSTYYNPDSPHDAYDPEAFKQAVESMGWKMGADGVYEKNGEKLAFRVDVRDYEEERIDIANVAARQFAAAGVQMKVNIVSSLDWTSLESFLIGQAAPFDPDSGTYALFSSGGSGNYTGYANPIVDQALREARAFSDEGARKRAYARFQEEWAKDPAYIMIAYLDGNYAAVPELKGISTERVLGHHAVGVMWNIEDWTLEPRS